MKTDKILEAVKAIHQTEYFIPQIVNLYTNGFKDEDFDKLVRDVFTYSTHHNAHTAHGLIEFMQRNRGNTTCGSNSFYDAFCDIDHHREELIEDGFSESFVDELFFDIDRLISRNRPN